MATLILDTQFHKGSLIEAVSGNVMVLEGGKFDRNRGLLNLGIKQCVTPSITLDYTKGVVFSAYIQRQHYSNFSPSIIGAWSRDNFVIDVRPNSNTIRYYYKSSGIGRSQTVSIPNLQTILNAKTHILIYAETSKLIIWINGVLTYTNNSLTFPIDNQVGTFTLNNQDNNAGWFYRFRHYFKLRIYQVQLTDSEIANEYQYFQRLTSPIKPIRKFIWDEINKRKIQTHLIETFENNAVGDLYGDPYKTNARPTVSELTTSLYDYVLGKKYLPSSGATNKYAYLKDSDKNKKTVYISIPSNTSTLTLGVVCNIRNGATDISINGYYLEFNCVTRTIAIKKQGGSQLAISANNVFSFNSLMKLEADFSDPTGIIVIRLNDIVIATSNADLTYTTCESILLNTKYMNVYEIESINI